MEAIWEPWKSNHVWEINFEDGLEKLACFILECELGKYLQNLEEPCEGEQTETVWHLLHCY